MNAEKRIAREVSSSRDLIERNDRLCCVLSPIEQRGKGIRRRRKRREKKEGRACVDVVPQFIHCASLAQLLEDRRLELRLQLFPSGKGY